MGHMGHGAAKVMLDIGLRQNLSWDTALTHYLTSLYADNLRQIGILLILQTKKTGCLACRC